MSSTPPHRKPPTEYEKARALWYKKLEEDGFQDIEQEDGKLKVWSSKLLTKGPPEVWQARAAYYQLAERFLMEFKFDSAMEKKIWTWHAEAFSVRDITKRLNAKKPDFISHHTVWRVVKKLERIMKNTYMPGYRESDEQ